MEPATNAPPRRYDWSMGSLLLTGMVIGLIVVLVFYFRTQSEDDD